MTCFDGIDFDHIQSERFGVLQLLLGNIQPITEEVVVCTGHPAETQTHVLMTKEKQQGQINFTSVLSYCQDDAWWGFAMARFLVLLFQSSEGTELSDVGGVR